MGGDIDLHAHVLPGLDDGPEDDEGALALALAAWETGTETLVATPHRSARWPTPPEAIVAGVQRLSARLEAAGIRLQVLPGAEVTVRQAAELAPDRLRALCLGDGPCILLESPHGPAGLELEATVGRLQELGHTVLLAHPERSRAFADRPERLRALVEQGVMCSVTAASLEGWFGPAALWSALALLREGLAHSIDSDAHHARLRPPGLGRGLAVAAERIPGIAPLLPWLTRDAPAAILAGAPLPERPERLRLR